MEALQTIPGQVRQYCLFTVETCAYAARSVSVFPSSLHFLSRAALIFAFSNRAAHFFILHGGSLHFEWLRRSGNVIKVQKMLGVCAEHLEENNSHQAVAALGIALISMGEEVMPLISLLASGSIMELVSLVLLFLDLLSLLAVALQIGADMSARSFEHMLQYGEINLRRYRKVPTMTPLNYVFVTVLTLVDLISSSDNASCQQDGPSSDRTAAHLKPETNGDRHAQQAVARRGS